MLPPDIIGLTSEQVTELKLVDVWADRCIPSGGWIENPDPVGRRNGRQPNADMQKILKKAIEDAKSMVGKNLVQTNTPLIQSTIQKAMDILNGSVTIVYPMQLPPHDPIRMEFTNTEDLSGTQASKEIIELAKGQIWFAGRNMLPNKILSEYLGTNNKTKVILKIAKCGEGAPAREPAVSEEARKQMMLQAYRRQETIKVSHIFIVFILKFLVYTRKAQYIYIVIQTYRLQTEI